MRLETLQLNPKNPRIMNRVALERLKESIQRDPEFMAARPIIVDETNMIVGGNQRYRACKELGLKEIPDSWVKKAKLTEAQKKRFVIVDNSPEGMSGTWDWDMLESEWDISMLDSLGMDVTALGNPAEGLSKDKIFETTNKGTVDEEYEAEIPEGEEEETLEDESEYYDEETMDSVPVTCPKCGHEFEI